MDKPRPAFALWGKTRPILPLYCHLVDVGNTALALLGAGTFGHIVAFFSGADGSTSSETAGWLAYLASLHDIGKCHGAFQAMGPPEVVANIESLGLRCFREPHFRHEAASAAWVVDHLYQEVGWDFRSVRTVSEACRGHHGDYRVDDPAPEPPGIREPWERARSDLDSLLRDTFAPWDWKPCFANHSVAGLILS